MFRDHRHHLSLIPSISGSFNVFYLKKKKKTMNTEGHYHVCGHLWCRKWGLSLSLLNVRVCVTEQPKYFSDKEERTKVTRGQCHHRDNLGHVWILVV